MGVRRWSWWKEDLEEEEGRKGRGRVREYREGGETAEGKEDGRGGLRRVDVSSQPPFYPS